MAGKNSHWNNIRGRLQPPPEEFTDFGLLEDIFSGNPIVTVLQGDGSLFPEDSSSRRRTITFIDESRLRCTESRVAGKFLYHYQLESKDGTKKFAWGSQEHGRDKRYQTETEPFHVHPPMPFTEWTGYQMGSIVTYLPSLKRFGIFLNAKLITTKWTGTLIPVFLFRWMLKPRRPPRGGL